MLLRSNSVGNGRITGVQRLMDGGSIPPSSTNGKASNVRNARFRARWFIVDRYARWYSLRCFP